MSKWSSMKWLLAYAGRFATRVKFCLPATAMRTMPERDIDTIPKGGDATCNPTPMQAIMVARRALETQIEAVARCGHVPDAYAMSLRANYQAELAEYKRLLGEAEDQEQASLRRLDALCPLPPVPEPAPLPRPRTRKFGRVSDWLVRGNAAGLPN